MTELHEGLCEKIIHATREELDMVTSVDVQMHNTISEAASMHWDLDLKDMWLTKPRWTIMCRQYLDGADVVDWLNKTAQLINWGGRGISMLRTKTVKARGGREGGRGDGGKSKETRRWGSCMLAVSYKAMPAPQITLYSRTSYLGYLAPMDLSVAWMLGRYLAEVMGGEVHNMRFVWFNEALQYHSFKSLAYFMNHTDEEKRDQYRRYLLLPEDELTKVEKKTIDLAPALIYSRRWMQRLLKEDADGKTLGDSHYNTYLRIKRRFHTEVLGYEYAQSREGWSYHRWGPYEGQEDKWIKSYKPLPHVNIHNLDFTPIGLPPLDAIGETDYDTKAAIQADEEDDAE